VWLLYRLNALLGGDSLLSPVLFVGVLSVFLSIGDPVFVEGGAVTVYNKFISGVREGVIWNSM